MQYGLHPDDYAVDCDGRRRLFISYHPPEYNLIRTEFYITKDECVFTLIGSYGVYLYG